MKGKKKPKRKPKTDAGNTPDATPLPDRPVTGKRKRAAPSTDPATTYKCNVDFGILVDNYIEENLSALQTEGVDHEEAVEYLTQEIQHGLGSFMTIANTLGAREGNQPLVKRAKLSPGVYVVDGKLQTPYSADGWSHGTSAGLLQRSRKPLSASGNRTPTVRPRRDWTKKEKKDELLRKRAVIFKNSKYSLEEDALVTKTGWFGKQPEKKSREALCKAYHDGTIYEHLRGFQRVDADNLKAPAVLADANDVIFCVRTEQRIWLQKYAGPALLEATKLLLEDTGYENVKLPRTRGSHDPVIIGRQRQYTKDIECVKFHRDNEAVVDKFIKDEALKGICKWLGEELWRYYPGVARRFDNNIKWYKENKGIDPEFPPFFTYCHNEPKRGGPKRVQCLPHVDSKNIVGVCVVLVYEMPGYHFDHKKCSWLVLWDAGIMLELPPWTAVIYPSSLFYHFNIDMHILLVPEGETPTPSNSVRLSESGEEGRGSIVFFNQASIFQSSETNSLNLKEAKKKGIPTTRNFVVDAADGFQSLSDYLPSQPPPAPTT
ncbi:hypothetical protein BDN72DRAFT_902767 [Pluteus cervinus]|uniref:Uncharacterized protein n=1 Tax=Pluteus cervinus TaxID=181527 RepID=A0ACD3ABT1_9AGAR|nr:hypothetical protein BDN72DRAFT_902767 [Pluteus cervinus]